MVRCIVQHQIFVGRFPVPRHDSIAAVISFCTRCKAPVANVEETRWNSGRGKHFSIRDTRCRTKRLENSFCIGEEVVFRRDKRLLCASVLSQAVSKTARQNDIIKREERVGVQKVDVQRSLKLLKYGVVYFKRIDLWSYSDSRKSIEYLSQKLLYIWW